MVSEDWYLDAVDAVESAAGALHESIDHVVAMLLRARRQRLDEVPLRRIVEGLVEVGGTETRRSVDEAFRVYTDAVTSYRAIAVRALVDEEGMTRSEVGRLTGVSRQMVDRLHRAAPTAVEDA